MWGIATVEPIDQICAAGEEVSKRKLVLISKIRMFSETENVLGFAPWFQDILYIYSSLM